MEIGKITKLANEMAAQTGSPVRFGWLLTNRSFLVPALGMVVNILLLLNFPLLVPVLELLQNIDHRVVAEYVAIAVTVLSFVWSFIERMRLRWKGIDAKVVVSRTDAANAVSKVVGDDGLAKALIKARL